MIDTPVMKRIPIPTQDAPWYKRLWRWLTWPMQWIVCKDYIQKIGEMIFFIPEGFIFDGASVPRIFWSVLSPVGLLLVQGVIHDFAYKYGFIWLVELDEMGEVIKKWKFGEGEKRTFWDTLFHKLGAFANGVNVVNWVAWAGVRIGGWHAWNKHRKNEGSSSQELPSPHR